MQHHHRHHHEIRNKYMNYINFLNSGDYNYEDLSNKRQNANPS